MRAPAPPVHSPPAPLRLAVRLDHVAALREARRGHEPDPVAAAVLAGMAGADSIVVHLREDRRHVQERDVRALRTFVRRLVVEVAVDQTLLEIVTDVAPQAVRLVASGREEVTAVGGMDCTRDPQRLAKTIADLTAAGIDVSCSIDADARQIRAAMQAGALTVELHTGRFAAAKDGAARAAALADLGMAAIAAYELGLRVQAGHGIEPRDIPSIVGLPGLEEVTIGHPIVARALLVGFEQAVRDARSALDAAAAPGARSGASPRGGEEERR